MFNRRGTEIKGFALAKFAIAGLLILGTTLVTVPASASSQLTKNESCTARDSLGRTVGTVWSIVYFTTDSSGAYVSSVKFSLLPNGGGATTDNGVRFAFYGGVYNSLMQAQSSGGYSAWIIYTKTLSSWGPLSGNNHLDVTGAVDRTGDGIGAISCLMRYSF